MECRFLGPSGLRRPPSLGGFCFNHAEKAADSSVSGGQSPGPELEGHRHMGLLARMGSEKAWGCREDRQHGSQDSRGCGRCQWRLCWGREEGAVETGPVLMG